MFRKRNGSLGFSFGRLVTNAVPNFATDNPERDADVSLLQQDLLFVHQLHTADSTRLDDCSFRLAGVVAYDSLSRQVHRALLKNLVLDPASGLPDTTKIGPQFTHQLAIISQVAQRKLIGVLFLWEEELMRWRLLDEEERDISNTIDEVKLQGDAGVGVLPDLYIALEQVRMRRAMRPSMRKVAEGEASQPSSQQNGSLPAYTRQQEHP